MHSLPLFHRVTGTRVVVVGSGDAAAAKRRLVERAGGECVGEENAGDARLAFVAVEEAADETAARLKARGLLVNVADRPELCDFTLPSMLERGDVLVAVSTGGASAGLAKHLRLRLEASLPQTLGALASSLSSAREAMRARWPDPDDRRRALDAALAESGALDPFGDGGGNRVADWLAGSAAPPSESCTQISLTSADPDDLTLRQARLLGMADTIVAGSDISPAILARARADAVRLGDTDEIPRQGVTVILRMADPSN